MPRSKLRRAREEITSAVQDGPAVPRGRAVPTSPRSWKQKNSSPEMITREGRGLTQLEVHAQSCSRLFLHVQAASSVLAHRAVPAIAIARNPAVNSSGNPANPWNQQNPCHELPTRKRRSDSGPGIAAAEYSSVRIDSLHQAQRFFAIHLRKSLLRSRVVQIQELDAPSPVEAPRTPRAPSA